MTGSFWKRHVQDTDTLQLTGRNHECKTADTPGTKGIGPTLRDGDQKLVFRTALGSVTQSAMVKLKRLVRHLVYLDVYGDSDWAGDEERKRSTTEVTEIFGCHLFDDGSATRSLIALSSAEAEIHACNRGTAGGLHEVIPQVSSDSSACRGIVCRTGSGRLRHLEIRHPAGGCFHRRRLGLKTCCRNLECDGARGACGRIFDYESQS